MVVIDLQGEIGWDIWPEEISEKLAAAAGDDIVVRFSSLGGNVFAGADIMNMFIDYKRDHPGVTMNLEIKALAASMGSAIASMEVWDDIGIDSVSAFMIHNPSSFAFGDFREMRRVADFLEAMRAVYSSHYSGRSGMSEAEISELMDAETWYFGQAIIDAGFADRIITADDPGAEQLQEEPELNDDQQTIIILEMKKNLKEMMKHQKEMYKDGSFDREKAAACLNGHKMVTPSAPKPAVVDDKTPAPKGGEQTEVSEVETKAELKKELPAVYDESVQDGVKMERERVAELVALKGRDEYKDIPEVCAAIDTAIAEGGSMSDAQTMMNAAMVKIMNDPNRMAALESSGDISGGNDADLTVSTGKKRTEV